MVAVKRVTIVIISLFYTTVILFRCKRLFFLRMRFRATNNDSEERNIMFLRKEGSFIHPSHSVLKIVLRTYVPSTRANWRRNSYIISYYFVIYSLKANMSFSREKLERDNLISYRTIYLTYQHISQIACKLDVPNLHQFEIVATNQWSSLFEVGRGISFVFLFIKRKRISFIYLYPRIVARHREELFI